MRSVGGRSAGSRGLAYAALALPWPARRVAICLALALLVAIGLHVAANRLAAPLGLKASYWPSSTTTGAPERSTDFAWLSDATRIEPNLDLRGEDFGLFFFNDAARFNFGADVQPGRD